VDDSREVNVSDVVGNVVGVAVAVTEVEKSIDDDSTAIKRSYLCRRQQHIVKMKLNMCKMD